LLGLVRGILTCQKFGPWDPDRKGPMVPLKRAIEYLDEFVTNLASSPPRSPVKPPTIKPAQMRLTRRQVRAQLDIPSPYFVSLGFDRAILDAMDVGHSRKLGRSVVPLYDESRHCIGYAARLEMPVCNQCGRCHDEHENCDRGQSKWTLSKGFPKSEYLYGIADVARSSAGCAIVLVEGVKEVWRLREANIPAVACLGSDLSAAQAKRLVSLRRELLVAFDNDQAGRDGARHARERLSKLRGLARILTVPGGFKDLAEMPATAVAEWFRASV